MWRASPSATRLELENQGIFELLDRVRTTAELFMAQSHVVTLNRGPGGTAEECAFDVVYQPVRNDQGSVDVALRID